MNTASQLKETYLIRTRTHCIARIAHLAMTLRGGNESPIVSQISTAVKATPAAELEMLSLVDVSFGGLKVTGDAKGDTERVEDGLIGRESSKFVPLAE